MTGAEPPSTEQVRAFWTWFASVADELQATSFASLDPALMSARVRTLHPRLAWEVGPGAGRECALVLSPSGRRELLPLTTELVSRAPSLDGWEFHASKPPKRWTRRAIELLSSSGECVQVDLDRWRYSLVAFDRCAFFDITFVLPRDLRLSEELALRAAWILLEGEFGERDALELFDRTFVLAAGDQVEAAPLSEVTVLREHVVSLRASAGH
jgi:hypothetical protein